MRIALDVSSAAKPDPTGIGRYVNELVPALALALGREDRLRLVVGPKRWKMRASLAPLAQLPGVLGPECRAAILPGLFTDRDELLHGLGVSLPATTRRLRLVTLHDVVTLDEPGLSSPRWARLRNHKVRLAIDRADLVLAVSEFVRRRALHHFPKLDPERTRVTRLGCDHAGLSPAASPLDLAVLEKYQLLHRPYVLSVGRVERRKNPDGLVRAFAKAAAAAGHLLVFAGPRGDSEVEDAIRETGTSQRVRLLQRVADAELGPLYRNAVAFVAVSHHEGFGLPLAEAMVCGTPSLASRRSAQPEVAGDAALLADSHDVESIASSLDRLLSDSELRRQLRERGYSQAAKFTWKGTARATLSAYHDLLAMGPRTGS